MLFARGLTNLSYVYVLPEVVVTPDNKPPLKLIFLVVYQFCFYSSSSST